MVFDNVIFDEVSNSIWKAFLQFYDKADNLKYYELGKLL